MLVIGGGATGLGCAIDAAARGYRTALIEAADFASGTSSRSTKLIHGGVRYLRQGNFALVRQALRERARLLANAPEMVRPLAFFVACANTRERLWYAAGLRLYDALAGSADPLPRSSVQSGGVQYYDAAFDDARLALALAQTAWTLGAALANYVCAKEFLYRTGRICGAIVTDSESGGAFAVHARAVINAAGVFSDGIRRLDEQNAAPLLRLSRGSHLVVPLRVLDTGGRALLVPKTADNRVAFVLPWHGHTLAGTTDVPCVHASREPRASGAEIDWLVKTLAHHTGVSIQRRDIGSVFAGLRALHSGRSATTAALSREHAVETAKSGLLTVSGGKWTTYRVMARRRSTPRPRSPA
ncbi:MAG: FAD-dependent oxidoreductase [Candidatus Baltobacteraceae bacterium]